MSTFEETDVAFQKAISGRTSSTATAVPNGPLTPICSVYKIIKPILQGLETFPIFPQTWKTAITDFEKVFDGLCPSGTSGMVNPVTAATATVPLTHEEIDAKVKAAIIAHWQSTPASGSLTAATAPGTSPLAGIANQICPVYKALKPILDLVKLFVPEPWGVGIGIAEQVLDQVCK